MKQGFCHQYYVYTSFLFLRFADGIRLAHVRFTSIYLDIRSCHTNYVFLYVALIKWINSL